MRRVRPIVLLAVFVATVGAAPAPAATYSALDPGGPARLAETVPVQFVFVGIEPGQLDEAAFRAGLPASYRPVVRSRLWYGVTEQLGIDYRFDYGVTYTSQQWEDAFFGFLTKRAAPAPLTLFQHAYNGQLRNVRDVANNHVIDAPTVEKRLVDAPPPGVDTRRNTVFFINWWGRSDFRFHVYTKTGEPDPDTGYDFGVRRDSRKIVAWGGTTPDDEETGLGARRGERRVWFYDLSAGPEAWGGSYNVDNHDIDGDGQADYRLPVMWEYARGGYRDPSALSGDLAKVARYGAINLLFTPSPLYPPYITDPRQPASINLDLNTFEGMAGRDASEEFQTPSLLLQEIGEVHRVPYTVDQQERPLAGEAADCYTKWLNSAKCYPDRAQYAAFANLFLYGALNIGDFWDGGGEYEAMFYNYASDRSAGFLGYAEDNWTDGTQSFTFNFVSPSIEAAGYGLTTTQIHEFGHHFGMSHPHDGYDSETGIDYGPSGRYFFAWLADEVNSMMSYIDLNWDYSQFDRDNANRFQAAAYLRNANAIAADILERYPGGGPAADELAAADGYAAEAQGAMAAHDYVATFDNARKAYEAVRAGAADAGVDVVAGANGWTVQPPRKEIHGPTKRDYSFRDAIGAGTQRSLP